MSELEETEYEITAIQAGRVFTPTSPIDERSLFSGRSQQVRLIVDVVNQKGQHAMLYGERGVGKTSLANVLASFLASQNVTAPRVNCDSLDTFSSVWKKVFEQVNLTATKPTRGLNVTDEVHSYKQADTLPDSVTPDTIRKVLVRLSQRTLPIIVIDEFDRLSERPRRAFADTIKTLSDHAVDATIVLVGVADSVEQLIAEHQSVERALVQVRMPRMSPSEIDSIIDKGLKRLGMTIEAGAKHRIAKLSQGLPHYAHLLGLHASRAALDNRSTSISPQVIEEAVDRSISGAQQSIRSHYEYAIRSPRKDNLFADVLLSCALAETNDLGFFAAQDVRQPLRKITKRQYEIPTFAQHLNEFCEPKRGPILQKTGSKRLYRYRFLNPLLQPFIIMQGLQSSRILAAMLD